MRDALSIDRIEALKATLHHALTRTQPGATPWDIGLVADPIHGLTPERSGFRGYSILGAGFDSRIEQGELLLQAELYETDIANIHTRLPLIEQAVASSVGRRKLHSVAYVQANPTELNDPALTE